jgi:flagellar biosynthetic protein FliP
MLFLAATSASASSWQKSAVAKAALTRNFWSLTPMLLAQVSVPPAPVPTVQPIVPAPTIQPVTAAPFQKSVAPQDPNEIRITGLGSGSTQWTIFVLLTFLTFIPGILICMTPFARLLIVFHFLRQALGLQSTPSNQTLIGLSMIMTFFIMQPVGQVIYRDSITPMQAGKISAVEALTRAGAPMRQFMSHYVRDKDAELFLEMAKEPRPKSINDLSFRVLLPAYILSELKAGFQIGAVLFLPFLVVDMVVASITTSVGMMQLPPVVISTPLKLLLFLMVDGWHLLIGALMRSFN